MKYHFIHTLVITPFEAILTPVDWDTLSAQDYPIHALYCKELNSLLFHSDNQNSECTEMISFLKQTLEILNIPAVWKNQIVIMGKNECEYDAQDVLKHFSH